MLALGGGAPRPHQVAPAPETEAHGSDSSETQSRLAASVIPRCIGQEEEAHADQRTDSNVEASAGRPASSQVTTGWLWSVLARGLRRLRRRMMTADLEISPQPLESASGIEMQFPMWVMPIHKFLGLTELLPHQELRRSNMLVERDDSMETVIFVSHQWTSFDHPDHTGRQLLTLQRIFARMIMGQVPEVDAPFMDKAAFTGKVKVASREWKGILRNAYIWVDFAGVPQKETTNRNDAASGSDGRCARNILRNTSNSYTVLELDMDHLRITRRESNAVTTI